jgi:ArsR family transcriptional regulator, arsenate/arsenite/antimonite-responsive transcriptional repressor
MPNLVFAQTEVPTEAGPDAAVLAQLLKALGEPNRLRIVNLLMEGVQCNCELGSVLDMAPNLISHHLRVLREIGLVRVERDAVDARWLYYSLDVDMLGQMCQAFGGFFDPARIKERHPACGPQAAYVASADLLTAAD